MRSILLGVACLAALSAAQPADTDAAINLLEDLMGGGFGMMGGMDDPTITGGVVSGADPMSVGMAAGGLGPNVVFTGPVTTGVDGGGAFFGDAGGTITGGVASGADPAFVGFDAGGVGPAGTIMFTDPMTGVVTGGDGSFFGGTGGVGRAGMEGMGGGVFTFGDGGAAAGTRTVTATRNDGGTGTGGMAATGSGIVTFGDDGAAAGTRTVSITGDAGGTGTGGMDATGSGIVTFGEGGTAAGTGMADPAFVGFDAGGVIPAGPIMFTDPITGVVAGGDGSFVGGTGGVGGAGMEGMGGGVFTFGDGGAAAGTRTVTRHDGVTGTGGMDATGSGIVTFGDDGAAAATRTVSITGDAGGTGTGGLDATGSGIVTFGEGGTAAGTRTVSITGDAGGTGTGGMDATGSGIVTFGDGGGAAAGTRTVSITGNAGGTGTGGIGATGSGIVAFGDGGTAAGTRTVSITGDAGGTGTGSMDATGSGVITFGDGGSLTGTRTVTVTRHGGEAGTEGMDVTGSGVVTFGDGGAMGTRSIRIAGNAGGTVGGAAGGEAANLVDLNPVATGGDVPIVGAGGVAGGPTVDTFDFGATVSVGGGGLSRADVSTRADVATVGTDVGVGDTAAATVGADVGVGDAASAATVGADVGVGGTAEGTMVGVGATADTTMVGVHGPDAAMVGVGGTADITMVGVHGPDAAMVGVGGTADTTMVRVHGPDAAMVGVGGTADITMVGVHGPDAAMVRDDTVAGSATMFGVGGPADATMVGVGSTADATMVGVGGPADTTMIRVHGPDSAMVRDDTVAGSATMVGVGGAAATGVDSSISFVPIPFGTVAGTGGDTVMTGADVGSAGPAIIIDTPSMGVNVAADISAAGSMAGDAGTAATGAGTFENRAAGFPFGGTSADVGANILTGLMGGPGGASTDVRGSFFDPILRTGGAMSTDRGSSVVATGAADRPGMSVGGATTAGISTMAGDGTAIFTGTASVGGDQPFVGGPEFAATKPLVGTSTTIIGSRETVDPQGFIGGGASFGDSSSVNFFTGGNFVSNLNVGLAFQDTDFTVFCHQFECNYPACYVPLPGDCKSYVVCQRTSMGTYVATRMRCAFGSYWTVSNISTCERVEDLQAKGYNCPNDPCRQDPTLKVYPEEDTLNCRSYWRCHGGVSKPHCCPQGQMFDSQQMRCADDPMEMCRAPCPLKQYGCSVSGVRTQPFYDGNCRTYWDCENGHPHPLCCAPGYGYDSATGECQSNPNCQNDCPMEYLTDVCGKITATGPVMSYSLFDGNCRTFMKCNPKGYDEAFCCRQHFYYNSQKQRCYPVGAVMDPCYMTTCPGGYTEECRFTKIKGKPMAYMDVDAALERPCANGTVEFDETICTCRGSVIPMQRCKAEVVSKFDHIDKNWEVHNYGDGHISTIRELKKSITANGLTYGTFDGSNGMEVWRYGTTTFPEATLKITFQPVASGDAKQILVSNCDTITSTGPSFEVSLDPANSLITFTGQTKTNAAGVSLQYNKKAWNTFTLLFDGQDVLALIEDPANPGKADSRSAKLTGKLLAGKGSLRFGPCNDANSVPMSNGFTGFISEVRFSKCMDMENIAFMKEVLRNQKQQP